jgi:hypothetical protein
MSEPDCKRKTRSDKFPSTLHPTDQYCKKIKGKLYYFGTGKQKALQRYLEQATDTTIKTLCSLHLEYQESEVQVEQLTFDYIGQRLSCFSFRLLTAYLVTGYYSPRTSVGCTEKVTLIFRQALETTPRVHYNALAE